MPHDAYNLGVSWEQAWGHQAAFGTTLPTCYPQRGDRIIDTDGTYEVSSPSAEPWYQVDTYGIELRIFTKRIA